MKTQYALFTYQYCRNEIKMLFHDQYKITECNVLKWSHKNSSTFKVSWLQTNWWYFVCNVN